MGMFNLPEKSVDGYRIDWWSTLNGEKVVHRWAIYHINTPWKKYSLDRKSGVDIIDDWMIYEEYRSDFSDEIYSICTGRCCGWKTVEKWTGDFLSWIEAANYVKSKLEKSVESKIEQLYRERNKLSRIVEEINIHG